MNLQSLSVTSILSVLIIMGAGCIGGPDTTSDNLESGDVSRVPAVEAELGFDLPRDAEITTVIDNPQAYSASFLSNISVHDLQAFFAQTLTEEGYSIKRQFGANPTDDETRTSSLYSKGDTILSINIFISGDKTSVGIQKQ